MASRTSLTGVAVSDGYPQLIHVSDSTGLHATTVRQLYDGDGTASCLYLATEAAKFVIGSDAGDDFIVNNGTTDQILVEGDAGITFGSAITLASGVGIATNTGTGTKIATATGQKLGFWNATAVVQQVKSDFSNLAAVSDIADLLSTLGLCNIA